MTLRVALFRRVTLMGIALSVASVVLFGCGPKKPAATPETALPAVSHPNVLPIDLQVRADDGAMTVRWKQQGTGVISGFNIFISREPLVRKSGTSGVAGATPHNSTVYPGDTNPEDQFIEYIADGLDNGVKYFVSVRVVFPDQTMSEPSNEVVAVCGPRGEFTLTVRFKSDDDGYSLASGRCVRADASDNDLYFFTKDGVDYLASPSRLNGYLRRSSLHLVSERGEFDDICKQLAAGEATLGERTDRLGIKVGNWLIVKTAQGHSALMQVKGFSGENDARKVSLWYALCPLTGEMLF